MNISIFQNSMDDTNARHLFAWLSTYKDQRFINKGREEREKLHTGAMMTVTLIIVSKNITYWLAIGESNEATVLERGFLTILI
jgi:hypothetical protein